MQKEQKTLRIVIRLALILAALGIATVALGNLAERWMIYPLDPTRVTPADKGLASVTEVTFENDGEILVAWAAKPAAGKPVILYFHGNAGNLAVRTERFRRLLKRGYGLFAPAYRGSSGSSGTPSETALLWDAETAYHAMFTQFPDLPPDKVVLYGESIGTAVSLGLLNTPATNPDKGFGPPAAVILEAPFTAIADLSEHHYPGTRALAERLDNQWPSLSRSRALTMPLLVLHGTADDLIPIEMGRQIYAAAPSGEKVFVAVKGAGHTDLWRSETLPRLWRFIDQFALR
ncbi:alpha/beta hydrolase [Pelagimonas sp. KU-00592-HH]